MSFNIQNYLSKKEEVEELKSEAVKQIPQIVEKIMREEGLRSFTACGYTPSFNDGDPCTYWFSVGTDYFEDELEDINSELEDGLNKDNLDFTSKAVLGVNKLYEKKGYSEFNNLFSRFYKIKDVFESYNEYGQKFYAFIDENDEFFFKSEDYYDGY